MWKLIKELFFGKPINEQLKEIQEEAIKTVAPVKKPRKPAGPAKERAKKNHK